MAFSKELKKEIEDGILDCRLLNIYKDPQLVSAQKERYCSAVKKFEEIYGEKNVEIFSAPGRSEVMGNHTDHQNGEVLAAGINLDAIAVVHGTDSETVKVVSGNYPKMRILPLSYNSLARIHGYCNHRNGTKDMVRQTERMA